MDVLLQELKRALHYEQLLEQAGVVRKEVTGTIKAYMVAKQHLNYRALAKGDPNALVGVHLEDGREVMFKSTLASK